MRKVMWELVEEGGEDVIIPLLHHLNTNVRRLSREIVCVWGDVVERES
jgi:hypothetical protein